MFVCTVIVASAIDVLIATRMEDGASIRSDGLVEQQIRSAHSLLTVAQLASDQADIDRSR